MAARSDSKDALAAARTEGDELVVVLQGRWSITAAKPSWVETRGDQWPAQVRFEIGELEAWDSALLLFLEEAQEWCSAQGATCRLDGLPDRMKRLLGELTTAHVRVAHSDRSSNFLAVVGGAALDIVSQGRKNSNFIGTCVISVLSLLRHPRRFRWKDCLGEMQQCGAMALPIVGLISLLVGLIMAYQAAVQLRQFGADIFVADLVGLSVVREMGPMMAAIVMAGRTGAAFAATLASMKGNEEIDALETLGVPPVEFLVIPRLVALAVMMPLLALYSNLLGILGGMAVSLGVLQIPPAAYWVETRGIIDLSDVSTGLIKSVTFGLLIGVAGCIRGLQADRSASGVGKAATSAVVTGILFIIVADAIFAVVFNILGL